jgi:hypothetical protein
MAKQQKNGLTVTNLGPIQKASIEFGDLNVSVGPQATGKSLLFQLLKLLTDADVICHEFLRLNADWGADFQGFLRLYFGGGMSSLVGSTTTVDLNGRSIDLESLVKASRRAAKKAPMGITPCEQMFYIPAQRIMAVANGLTRPFSDFYSGDPYVLREFSDTLHGLVQTEFSKSDSDTLFPQPGRLNDNLRSVISEAFFRGFDLKVVRDADSVKRLMLSKGNTNLPFMTWSAGQREFTPLLLGLYWLLPAGRISLREKLTSVVIEEPEMGLHPRAIHAFMAIVLELMRRGYRVFLTTHSSSVLDVVWGLQTLQRHGGKAQDVLDMLGLNPALKEMAEKSLHKRIKVSYFDPGKDVIDISALDPGADDAAESGWGGLTSFTGQIGDVVARVVNRHEASEVSR